MSFCFAKVGVELMVSQRCVVQVKVDHCVCFAILPFDCVFILKKTRIENWGSVQKSARELPYETISLIFG